MQRYSIIIPTLNEEGNIQPLLQRIQMMAQHNWMSPEILFVDDGSGDGTREQIETYEGPLQVRLIKRDNVRELTGAVVAGAQAATNPLLIVMDSDLSHPPEAILSILELLATGSHDIVIGSRYIRWRRHTRLAGFPQNSLPYCLIPCPPAHRGLRSPCRFFRSPQKCSYQRAYKRALYGNNCHRWQGGSRQTLG